MKGMGGFLSVMVLTATLWAESADKKWIPIEPIKVNENSKREGNISKLQVSPKMLQNLKVIKNLLDHVNKDGLNNDNPKNWYSLEPTDE